jgi:hypothetical protein
VGSKPFGEGTGVSDSLKEICQFIADTSRLIAQEASQRVAGKAKLQTCQRNNKALF